MKRRSFLGLLGGAVAAPFASTEAAPKRPTIHFGLMGKFERQDAASLVSFNSRVPYIGAGDWFTIEGDDRTFEVVA